MSLLLEALKKAELAKQGKKPADGERSALAIAVEPAPSRPGADTRSVSQPIITREELPDISQPLEILSEDLPSSAARRKLEPVAVAPLAEAPPPEPELEPERERAAAAAQRELQVVAEPSPAEPAADASAEQEAARQLFEAKEVEYNPKRNFYITIGVLLTAGAGYGGYVWWQLQPRSVYNTAAVQNAPKAAPAPAVQVSQPATPASEPQAPSAAAATPQIPAAPAPAAPPPGKATPSPASAATETEPAAPKGPVFARSASGPPKSGTAGRSSGAPDPAAAQMLAEQSSIAITPPVLAVDPLIGRAFDAYTRGDLAAARESYQQVLQRDPLSRDALLGLAAIDVRSRSFDTAGARYARLLELDPRDMNAMAGLIGLRGQIDPGQWESRLKTLIAVSPDAAPLHFALGNLFAQQSRWAEAQAAYFRAYSGEPENADFAFNLAVSLDQLRQKAPALQYYQRAAALAAGRPVSFDPARAEARIQELRR